VYDIRMPVEVLVQSDLHIDLLRGEPAMLKGVFFVDKLDGNDRFLCIDGDGFADRGVGALTDGFADEAEGKVRGEGSDLTLRNVSIVEYVKNAHDSMSRV
jgi:hypothetical protein